MRNNGIIKSANLHLTGICNYDCEHCFARNLSRKHITPAEWEPIIDYLAKIGVTKINFAGGEPVLYPQLKELASMVKSKGFTTSIVSNGSLMDEKWFKEMDGLVDWVGLSVDSPSEEDEIVIGRHCRGIRHLENVVRVSEMAHVHGMKVKLNITVVRRSWNKDFHPLVSAMNPERTKVFRALTLKNENDDIPDVWSITDEQFADFKQKHCDIGNIVFEDNSDMVDTYLMFDPLGKWMVNNDQIKAYLPFEILRDKGVEYMLDVEKYYGRDAVYEW